MENAQQTTSCHCPTGNSNPLFNAEVGSLTKASHAPHPPDDADILFRRSVLAQRKLGERRPGIAPLCGWSFWPSSFAIDTAGASRAGNAATTGLFPLFTWIEPHVPIHITAAR